MAVVPVEERSEPVLVLVHSPLLGAVTWQPVAEVLRSRARAVAVPSLAEAFTGPGPYGPRLVAAVAENAGLQGGTGPVTLVGHSGAGTLLPAVAAALETAGRPVRGTVYADALLPHPGRSWMETVPADQAASLRALAAPDGCLPPWHEWLPADALAGLLPDPAVRAWFCADVPRVPVAYTEEKAPAGTPHPDRARTAYLRLSSAYEESAATADAIGYRVLRRTAHHLAMVTDPEDLAGAVVKLTDAFPRRGD